ncbi:hypothetical protein JOC86_000357 [Bacillus pakistanensis]|uniref:Uncharacterized protein n=1 Tax=Rossellomorea pakistanensis TaxID=992288 RepID=A0ABS2N7I0_9BACI|nr:hypothetical protein [Bacillus pakistanensis]MBM7583820.1 hypothetical protein [Bacillus pakistanensis]
MFMLCKCGKGMTNLEPREIEGKVIQGHLCENCGSLYEITRDTSETLVRTEWVKS